MRFAKSLGPLDPLAIEARFLLNTSFANTGRTDAAIVDLRELSAEVVAEFGPANYMNYAALQNMMAHEAKRGRLSASES